MLHLSCSQQQLWIRRPSGFQSCVVAFDPEGAGKMLYRNIRLFTSYTAVQSKTVPFIVRYWLPSLLQQTLSMLYLCDGQRIKQLRFWFLFGGAHLNPDWVTIVIEFSWLSTVPPGTFSGNQVTITSFLTISILLLTIMWSFDTLQCGLLRTSLN